MLADSYIKADKWMELSGPEDNVVVSSRARVARNIDKFFFPTYADDRTLKEVATKIDNILSSLEYFKGFTKINFSSLPPLERCYLRESRLISKEFEIGGFSKILYLSQDRNTSIMINEEDHLRMQSILPGFQAKTVLIKIQDVDEQLRMVLSYAFSPRFGYLTSCPTNTGTGLRISLMLHLPGLTLMQEMDSIFSFVSPYGMTIRGFNGENSESIGDFYQLSNDITMGKTEEEILKQIEEIFNEIYKREKKSREIILSDKKYEIEDRIWRSYGILTNARKINSSEALNLLSIIRLGIEGGYIKGLDNHFLNQLITKIQPGHIQWGYSGTTDAEVRDKVRAEILREIFQGVSDNN